MVNTIDTIVGVLLAAVVIFAVLKIIYFFVDLKLTVDFIAEHGTISDDDDDDD